MGGDARSRAHDDRPDPARRAEDADRREVADHGALAERDVGMGDHERARPDLRLAATSGV